MTPRQKELLDVIAASTTAARLAVEELRGKIDSDEVRDDLDQISWHLREVADDARAEHASGLLCEVFEELKHAEADAARGCACDGCRAGGA